MKKALIVTLVVALLAVIVTATIVQRGREGGGEKVYVERVARRDLTQIVKASGQVDPRVKVEIAPHVVARIDKLYVREGQDVERGQPFLELERETFVAARQRAAAQLEIARSVARQAEIDLADARVRRQRAERLVEERIAPAEQLESAELAAESASLRLAQAREAVLQAQADLDKAADDLRKTTIYAPISGRVISLQAEEGEVVVTGTLNNPAAVIGVVADLSEIVVEVAVDETDIVHVAPGQQATVVVDALPDHPWRGRVVEIGSSGFERPQQPDVTYFAVDVLLDDADERLRPGMSARAEIEVATHRDTLVVPIQTVVYRSPVGAEGAAADEEIRVAFVVDEGRARQRPVAVGLSDVTHAEVLSGLAEGDLVVTGPHRTLEDLEHGDAVRVATEEDEAEGRSRDGDEDPAGEDAGED